MAWTSTGWMASMIKAVGFTNITRDHMDYHPTFDDYLAAKLRLFSEVVAADGVAVVNADAEHADAFIAAAKTRGPEADHRGPQGRPTFTWTAARIAAARRKSPSAMPARFTPCCCRRPAPSRRPMRWSRPGWSSGWAVMPTKVFAALEHLKGAPGRMEKVAFSKDGAPIYVDYAHTPDSLDQVLQALRPHTAGRLHVVFGCGGDRDKGKRPLMGAIAVRLADDVIVTDDNPRTEDAATIRAEILAAAPGAREIGDRHDAIRAAVEALGTGDVLILAGKGHESGQYINGVTYPFSDRDEAVKAAVMLGGRAA